MESVPQNRRAALSASKRVFQKGENPPPLRPFAAFHSGLPPIWEGVNFFGTFHAALTLLIQ
jgi:hypothetical protein